MKQDQRDKKPEIATGKKAGLVREKLIRDLELFFKEYSVREIGNSGLLITSKI